MEASLKALWVCLLAGTPFSLSHLARLSIFPRALLANSFNIEKTHKQMYNRRIKLSKSPPYKLEKTHTHNTVCNTDKKSLEIVHTVPHTSLVVLLAATVDPIDASILHKSWFKPHVIYLSFHSSPVVIVTTANSTVEGDDPRQVLRCHEGNRQL